MSQNITNTAKITYDNKTFPATDPLITRVEPNLEVHVYATTENGRFTNVGTIGENRKVTYDIILVNYSSVDFTNVIIRDIISIPENLSVTDMTYLTEESMYVNRAELPNIQINVGTISPETQKIVHYTLEFSEEVPMATIIKNNPNVDYRENTNKDEKGETIPIKGEEINLKISYDTITVISTKTAPRRVLSGEDFDYVLRFNNKGANVATGVSVSDNLPEGFIVNSVSVINGGVELERGVHFDYNEEDRPLIISNIHEGTSLDILPKQELIIIINGKLQLI